MSKVVDDLREREYSQGRHLNHKDVSFLLSFAPDARDGVCQALAQYWIQQKLKELTETGRKSSQVRIDSISNDVLVEAIELFNSFGGNHHLRVLSGAQKYGLLCHKQTGLCAYNQGHGNKELIDVVTGEKNACYLIQFSVKQQGRISGHAIACYCSSGKILGGGQHVYLFDPNFGEYKVTKSDFRAWWWQQFMKEKYGIQNIGEVDNHFEIYPYVLAPKN